MEIIISQPINNQKKKPKDLWYQYIYPLQYVFMEKSIFIWIWKHFPLSSGLIFYLPPPPSPATTNHILETVPRIKIYILLLFPSGIHILVDPQKYHIGVLLTDI